MPFPSSPRRTVPTAGIVLVWAVLLLRVLRLHPDPGPFDVLLTAAAFAVGSAAIVWFLNGRRQGP